MIFEKLLRSIKKRLVTNPRPSLHDLDRKLEKHLNFQGGFFIEAGANDGYTQSNTYYFEHKRNWRGLLVEGVPESFEKCKKRRPNAIVENCALVADDYDQPTVDMHYANLMTVVEGSQKTEIQQARYIQAGLDVQRIDHSYTVSVPARTLKSVLDDIPDLPVVDFLSLDVEGYELNVLKGLQLEKYRPRYILVEALFFDEVDAFLTDRNYELLEQMTCHDFFYRAR